METKNKLGVLITLFLGVIVALAMLPQIANSVEEMTEMVVITDEAYSLDGCVGCWDAKEVNESKEHQVANYPDGWRLEFCGISGFVIGNATQDFAITTDYTVNTTDGTFKFVNSTYTMDLQGYNDTLIDYEYCNEGYIHGSGGRGIAKLILIFAALAILGYAIYLGTKEYL